MIRRNTLLGGGLTLATSLMFAGAVMAAGDFPSPLACIAHCPTGRH